jgi:uroporphyrinogen-III synthase
LAELVKERRSIAIAAISTEAADAAGTGWEAIGTAEATTDDALLALAARLCNTSSPE